MKAQFIAIGIHTAWYKFKEWLRCKYNQFQFWRHSHEIELLVSSFLDDKHLTTGIAQRPEDMVSFFQLHGIPAKKANRVIRICILHDIIRDQPCKPLRKNSIRNQHQSKQFYYILNPEFLQ